MLYVEKLLETLSEEQLLALNSVLPAEFARRGLPLGSLAVDHSVSGEVDAVDTTHESSIDVYATVTKQLPNAYSGYGATTEGLNKNRATEHQLAPASQETLVSEFGEWLTVEKLIYVAKAQEADPTLSFTLVATPNVEVGVDEVASLTDYAYQQLYSQYTPQQLTGYNPNGGSFKFSLVPSKFDESLTGTIAFQTTQLAKMQEDHPFLRVPRPLEAFTHARTIEALDGELTGPSNFGRVFVKSFDLPTKSIDGHLYVPSFDVFDDGGSHFSRSNVFRKHHARIAVG